MTTKKKTRYKQSWWDKFIVPSQILHEGAKATLIIMPKGSPFEGYKMWMPNKLVIYGYPYVTIRFAETMDIHLFNGKKEIQLTGKEFMGIETCGQLSAKGGA